jgi:hypothetical protein
MECALNATKLIIFNLGLLLLAACGQSQQSGSIEVTQSFASTNGRYGGGLILHGIHSLTNKTFTLSLDQSLSANISLEAGEWSIRAIGWMGDDSDNKFTGDRHCGYLKHDFSTSARANIALSASVCSEPDIDGEHSLRLFNVVTCGTFYQYNPTTHSFSDLGTTDGFCASMPMELKSELSHYRVVARNRLPTGTITNAFISQCYHTVGEAMLTLPTKNIPFVIRAYSKQADCVNQAPPRQVFDFPNGLEAGNWPSFDKNEVFTPTSYRLILPSSISRRGYSPFMSNMLPRIRCGSSGVDCVSDPTLSNTHVHVPWMRHSNHEKSILRFNTTASTCPADTNLLTFRNCENKNNNLIGQVFRRELFCQAPDEFPGEVIDTYFNGTKYFVLYSVGGARAIRVYSAHGEELFQQFMDSTAQKIAALANDYLVISNGQALLGYNFQNGSYVPDKTYFPANPSTIIDVATTGNFIYAITNDITSSKILRFSTSSSTQLSADDSRTGGAVFYALYTDANSVYALGKIQPTGGGALFPNITTYSVGISGALSPSASVDLTTTLSSSNLHLTRNEGVFYILENSISARIISKSSSAENSTNLGYPATNLDFFNGKLHTASSTSIRQLNLDTTYSAFNERSGSCSLNGTILGQPVRFQTAKLNAYMASRKGLEYLGRRSFSNAAVMPSFMPKHFEDGKVIGGGVLEKVETILSSAAIGGLVSKFSTSCSALKAGAPYTGGGVIYDSLKNENVTVSFTLTSTSTAQDNYICNPTAFTAGSGCSQTYDLILDYATGSFGQSEKGKIKLVCGEPKGVFETLARDNQETRRELIAYDTTSLSSAKAEFYDYSVGSNTVYAKLGSLTKFSEEGLSVRAVQYVAGPSGVSGFAEQINRGGSQLAFKGMALSQSTVSDFFSANMNIVELGSSFDVLRANTTFTDVPASSCLSFSGSSLEIYSAGLSTCSMNSSPQATVYKQIDLNLDSFFGLSSSTHPLREVFTIPATSP